MKHQFDVLQVDAKVHYRISFMVRIPEAAAEPSSTPQPRMCSQLGLSAGSILLMASAGTATVSRCTEAAISPISLIMARKKPAGVLSNS